MIELMTPCGYLNLIDESGGFVSFDVYASERDHLTVYDDVVDTDGVDGDACPRNLGNCDRRSWGAHYRSFYRREE